MEDAAKERVSSSRNDAAARAAADRSAAISWRRAGRDGGEDGDDGHNLCVDWKLNYGEMDK